MYVVFIAAWLEYPACVGGTAIVGLIDSATAIRMALRIYHAIRQNLTKNSCPAWTCRKSNRDKAVRGDWQRFTIVKYGQLASSISFRHWHLVGYNQGVGAAGVINRLGSGRLARFLGAPAGPNPGERKQAMDIDDDFIEPNEFLFVESPWCLHDLFGGLFSFVTNKSRRGVLVFSDRDLAERFAEGRPEKLVPHRIGSLSDWLSWLVELREDGVAFIVPDQRPGARPRARIDLATAIAQAQQRINDHG